MKPRKYPYLGTNKKKPTKEEKLELVVFPNIAFRKTLLKYVFSVVKQHDNTTIIYFRIPKLLGGYEEERAKVHLSYEKTMRILNSY